MNPMIFDRKNKVWCECGKRDFLEVDSSLKTPRPNTSLGCKWSLVQIQSRRPIYLPVITRQSKEIRRRLLVGVSIISKHIRALKSKESVAPVWCWRGPVQGVSVLFWKPIVTHLFKLSNVPRLLSRRGPGHG